MAAYDVEKLLSDSRLVVDYAARAGMLQDDSLPKTIETTEGALRSGSVPDVPALVAALNRNIKSIAPMTLIELRRGMNPYDERGCRANNRNRLVICAMSVLWVCLIAYFTQLLHREQTVIQTVQLIQDSHPLNKMNALIKMVKKDGVLNKNDAHLDEYNQQLDELRTLQEKAAAFNSELGEVARGTGWPLGDVIRDGVDYLRATKGSPALTPVPPPTPATSGAPAMDSRGVQVAQAGVMVSDATTAPLASDGVFVGNPNLPSAPGDGCDPNQRKEKLAPFAKDTEWAWLTEVILNFSDLYCFSSKTNISAFQFNLQPTSALLQELQRRITLQTGWILPALYGLLGASMFLMRDMLNMQTAPVSAFAATIRIALGAMAGIIIGWFSVPTGGQAASTTTISAIPFGLAFLAGFSIDLLYSLLDRLNKGIGGFTEARTGT